MKQSNLPGKILIISGPWSKTNLSMFTIALKLMRILGPLCNEITWVVTNCSGDEENLPEKVNLIKLSMEETAGKPIWRKALYHLKQQIRIILKIRKIKGVDAVIFSFGARLLILPFLFTTLVLRRKTILRIDGRTSVKMRNRGDRKYKVATCALIERVMYSLSYRIAPAHDYMVEYYDLQKYHHKISIATLYVDTSFFRQTKELAERVYDVGYIGRLSAQKGVLEFAQSLPMLAEYIRKVIIVGDGILRRQVTAILASSIPNSVELAGWVKNEEIPAYLNATRLLVVPSYSEGLPNIVLEAMACGTLVLATRVGAIPGLIKDGESGFLMENNSPECIARNIIRALNHSELEKITKNACALVKKEYTYKVVIERYRKILGDLFGKR